MGIILFLAVFVRVCACYLCILVIKATGASDIDCPITELPHYFDEFRQTVASVSFVLSIMFEIAGREVPLALFLHTADGYTHG